MTFRGFDASQVSTLNLDIAAAGRLAQRCVNRLAFNPSGLDPAVGSLLSDMFGTDGSDADKLGEVRRRFAACGTRLNTVNYIFTTRQPTTASNMGHVAFVEFNPLIPLINDMNVTRSYFPPRQASDRVLTLIHEFIHLFNRAPGHPGGQFQFFMRAATGLDFDDAVLNPYCYEGFAKFVP